MIDNRKIVALCIARIQDDASNEYVTALKNVLTKNGYGIFVYNTCSTIEESDWRSNPEIAVYDYMDYDIIDAVVVFEEVMRNKELSDMLIERAKSHGVPTIVIGDAHKGCINIKFDHASGLEAAVRHVIEVHNCTKLHFMAGVKGNKFSEERLQVFKNVLAEKGMTFDDSMVSYGDFWWMPTEQAMEKLIAEDNIPQAVVCANDRMAITVSGVLQKHGLRVPDDVIVTGFDGITEINFSVPRITSGVCEHNDLAAQTLRVLNLLENKEHTEETYLVPLRLCVAESCGCQGGAPLSVSEYLNSINDRLYRYQGENIILSQISDRIQRCDTIEQMAEKMRDPIFYDMQCVMEEECFDESVNPNKNIGDERPKDREMLLLFNSDVQENFVPYKMSLKNVIQGLDYMLEHNRVMIFTALHHGDVPMGYVCFTFSEALYGNYLKVPQTVISLNTAIGGYRNARHKHYLMNQIDEMYRIDMLTGLRNRRGFEIEYQKLLQKKSENQSLTVVMADLDGLKFINDNYGHKEGDFAIHAAARGLVTACPEGAIFTRFGGDEMLAVCPGEYDAESIKKAFYEYFDGLNAISNKEYRVSASIGIYHTKPEDMLDFENIIEYADKLMYEEKLVRKGRRN